MKNQSVVELPGGPASDRPQNKLNFGCGHRFAEGWVNIDFHSEHPSVRPVNLLRPLPFADNSFDAVYSSHVLEHFSPPLAERILGECRRIIRPGGVIRTVVPDLAETCREYLRVLDRVEDSELARRQYDWVILELLDQLTRTEPSGRMGSFRESLIAAGDQQMMEYVRSRTESTPWTTPRPSTLRDKMQKLRLAKIKNKLIYLYIAGVKQLFPRALRDTIVDNSRIGEKHRWMYDRHNLAKLMQRCDLTQIKFHNMLTSSIPGFAQDGLDAEPDGSPYKPLSLYCEASKP